MDELTKRRDRMIAAYREMTSHTERLPGRRYGSCSRCGAMIEWVETKNGKKQPCVPNMGEPHFPHCGKDQWTIAKWTEVMRDILELEREHNEPPRVTVPTKNGFRLLSPSEARQLLNDWKTASNTTRDAPW